MDGFLRETVAGGISRRRFIRRAALTTATLSALPMVAMRSGLANTREVSVASYGGLVNNNVRKAFADPFEKQTGIKVNLGANASLALAKLQAASNGPAQWDIIELTGAQVETAAEQNLLVPYDYKVVDTSQIPPEYKQTYGIRFFLYTFLMAWDQRKIADDKAPTSWAEFWDTKRYPTKRSLYANISDGSILEAALLADGVPIDHLYPLDLGGALKSLDRLGRDHIIWHNTNAEPIQQLTSGEVALATSFGGRVISAGKSGAKIGYTMDYGAVDGSYWCVMRTSAHQREAFELINFVASNAKAEAEYTIATSVAMPNTEAEKLVPPNIARNLPTNPALKGKIFLKDDAWWAENLEATETRFKEWQLAG